MKTFRCIFGLMALFALMLSNPFLSHSAPQDSVRRVRPNPLPQGEQVFSKAVWLVLSSMVNGDTSIRSEWNRGIKPLLLCCF